MLIKRSVNKLTPLAYASKKSGTILKMVIQRSNPTIADVARYAKVSIATVSRVLNNADSVSEQTRHKIKKALNTLGYTMNPNASALSTGRTHSLGVLSFGSALSAPGEIIKKISIEAHKHNVAVMVGAYEDHLENGIEAKRRINKLLENMYRSGVSAIICIQSWESSAKILYEYHFRVPVFYVMMDTPSKMKEISNHRHKHHSHQKSLRKQVNFVTINQKSGVKQVLQAALDRGYQKLLFVSGVNDSLDNQTRLDYTKQFCKEHSIELAVIETDSWLAKPGFHGIVDYLSDLKKRKELSTKRTVIFAANDLLAIGVLRGLNELQISVPDDVGVVGFDNIAGTDFLVPSLTTVHQSFDVLSKKVVKNVMRLLDGEMIKNKHIKPKLILRESL